jgi:hypothetical protein
MEKNTVQKRVLGKKKGFILWPKNEEVLPLLENQFLNSRDYRSRIGTMRDRDGLIKERNIHIFSE